MDKQFSKIEEKRKIFAGDDFSSYVVGISALPDPDTAGLPLGTCYLLTDYNDDGYKPGVIYILQETTEDDVTHRIWEPIDVDERGTLVWETQNIWKRLTPEYIELYWTDPPDNDSEDNDERATWSHDVIVRKRGSAPSSPDDGEIVGYSCIFNQWSDTAFSDPTANKPGFVSTLGDVTDYIYRVFAFAKSGKWVGSAPVVAAWTWETIHDEIQIRHPNKAFRVGDIFPMPACKSISNLTNGERLHAQIMDFNYSTPNPDISPSSINSITFMTVEVIANMSFDNKELEYALTSDVSFKSGKKYFLKNGNTFNEFVPRAHGFNYGTSIPETYTENDVTNPLRSVLYELHPSIRYFESGTSSSAPRENRIKQTPLTAGSGNWDTSNLKSWMSSKFTGSFDVDAYLNNEATGFIWHLESAADRDSWKALHNGWFSASYGNYHNLAPASMYSATYIQLPPLPNGFDDEEGVAFLSHLMHPYTVTILDQYIYRHVRNDPAADVSTGIYNAGTQYAGASDVINYFFWLPSFEEVFGRRSVFGINGRIDTTGIAATHEGRQFAYFASNSNWKEARTKYLLSDGSKTIPVGWYLRSCDPTTVSRVFYVSPNLPERDTGASIETTCTAHRYTVAGENDEPVLTVGPAVCFTYM